MSKWFILGSVEYNKDNETDDWYDTCQLCGYGILSPRRIKHDDQELVMSIGSECVKHYTEIGTAKHTIRMQEEKEIKEMYLQWRDEAYRYIWRESKLKNSIKNMVEVVLRNAIIISKKNLER